MDIYSLPLSNASSPEDIFMAMFNAVFLSPLNELKAKILNMQGINQFNIFISCQLSSSVFVYTDIDMLI